MPSPSHRLALAALRALPKHWLSRLAGRAVALPLPPAWQAWEVRAFGRAVGVNFDEVRDPLTSFRTLQDFFTRALVDGARPIDPAADAVVAPCDGTWGASGGVTGGTLLQVKGRSYSLAALLGDAAAAARFEGGVSATFYLSPRDYHRFHSPCAARVLRATYLPGALWPVNRIGVEGIEGLFARNERLCAFLSVRGAGIDLCLVAVGATMVGKVRVTFDDLTTNRPGVGAEARDYSARDIRLAKGEEWGRFEFGSTIVMIAAPGLIDLDVQAPGSALRLGECIGRLRSPSSPDRATDGTDSLTQT
ncbi:MAG: archaetidylserine decarboxylase [Candidatus Binatia bacterium]